MAFIIIASNQFLKLSALLQIVCEISKEVVKYIISYAPE